MTCCCRITHWALTADQFAQHQLYVAKPSISHLTSKPESRLSNHEATEEPWHRDSCYTLYISLSLKEKLLAQVPKICSNQRTTRSFSYRWRTQWEVPPTICFSLPLERMSVHKCRWVMHLCRKRERNKRNVYLGGLASVLLERFFLKGSASCTYTPFPGHFPLQCWSLSLLSPCHSHSRPRHC